MGEWKSVHVLVASFRRCRQHNHKQRNSIFNIFSYCHILIVLEISSLGGCPPPLARYFVFVPRAFANLALALIGLCALALGGLLLLPGPSLAGPATFSLPVGVESMISLEIKNRSASVLRIVRVDTSCGCLSDSRYPETVAPFRTGRIDFTITPRRSEWGEPQTVQVVLSSGRTLVSGVTILPVPIWNGFPEPFRPESTESGDWIVQLSPAYSTVIDRVELDLGNDILIPADWDPETAVVRVEPAVVESGGATLILIGPDGQTPIWAERTRFPRD